MMQKTAVLVCLKYLVLPFLRKVSVKTTNTVDDTMVEWAETIVDAVSTVK